MPDLTRDQRRALEATMKTARDLAEAGAADALRRLGAKLNNRQTFRPVAFR